MQPETQASHGRGKHTGARSLWTTREYMPRYDTMPIDSGVCSWEKFIKGVHCQSLKSQDISPSSSLSLSLSLSVNRF